MLRRRELELAPTLSLTVEQGRYVVEARHTSYDQLGELRLVLVDDQGKQWPVTPSGTVEPRIPVVARAELQFYAADRPFRLMEGNVPALPAEAEGSRAVELRAVLVNPGTTGDHAFARISDEVRAAL